MLLGMSEHDRKAWTKQDGEAAARLLAGLCERAKKGKGREKAEGRATLDPGPRAVAAEGRTRDGLETVCEYRVGGKTLVADNDHAALNNCSSGASNFNLSEAQ